jgi:enoyl-CoA hydratase/carnithine racemase
MAPYHLEIEDHVACLSLDAGKGNAMDPTSLAALERGLIEAEDRHARGLVLTGTGRFFSAGLNIPVLYQFDRVQMSDCMRRFREVMLRVLRFPGRTVAAINGHAIAGGAILACACDLRVAARGDYRIGVSEVAIGIGLPRVALEVLRRALPERTLEEIVLGGNLYGPEEARDMGFLNDLVSSESLAAIAHERAARFTHAPFGTLRQVKHELVAPTVERVLRGGEDQEWLDTWFSEEARRLLAGVVARLSA